MKSSSLSRAVSLITVVCMALAMLSGCATSSPSAAPAQSSAPAASAAAATGAASAEPSAAAEAKDPLGKYDPPIEITFVRSVDNDITSNILPKTPGETMEDNRWLKQYSEKLGINIKYDWTVKGGADTDAYKQKLNVTLASGDLPDVTPVSASQLKQLADSDMIMDMTQYFNDYASPMTKKYYTLEGKSVLDSAKLNGKLMAIPNLDASIESAQFLWIRADWLKKLGLEAPKTMDDLIKVAQAFTTQDPDGNGVADTYGLAITKDLYSGCMGLQGFFAGYHAYPNFWMKDSAGKIAYGSVQPETKAALKALADMYKAGVLDKEFGVKDVGKVAETIAAGKIGIDFGEQWNPMYPLISDFNNNNNADWTGYPLASIDDKPISEPLKFRTATYYAVRKGYEHPEALVKLINEHLDKNWGEGNEFGKYYMPKENGNVGVWKFSPVTPAPPYKNLDAFKAIEKARANNDLSVLKDEPKIISDNVAAYAAGDKAQWGWEKIYGVNGVMKVLEQYEANGQLMVESFTGAPTPTMVEKKTTLDKMEVEEFVKIIMGEVPVDDFDKFVSDWMKLGGEAMINEANAWYDSVK